MKKFTTIRSGLIVLSFVTIVFAVPNIDLQNVHLHMDDEELSHIFPTLNSATIPEYEVVALKWPRLHRRSSGSRTRIRMNAFGKDIKLWLHPTEGTLAAYDTPVILAKSSESMETGVELTRMSDAMLGVGKMLEDREKRATMMVKRSVDGRNYLSGIVGSEGWIVRPLPDRFNAHSPTNRSSSSLGMEEFDKPHWHVIYRSPEPSEGETFLEKPIENKNSTNQSLRSKRAVAPTIVYPQILVFADFDTYKMHGKNVSRLLEYLLPFWNGVDLRYRSLEFPKVRLNIAGIVVATDSGAFSFVTENKVDSGTLNILGTVSDFGKFLPTVKSTFPFANYDVAVTMAPFDMCSSEESCQIGLLGIAYLEGACDLVKRGTPMNLGVAVIQDRGAFDGMHAGAHELGHLFGASHDGREARSCPSDVGNIMASTPKLTKNSEDWSKCSLVAFDKFFNSEKASCVFNKPKTLTPLERDLPGRLMTLDQQCAKLEGTKQCKTSDDPCMSLRCVWSRNRNYCKEMNSAGADGSKCGDKKICIHGICLRESELV